MSRKSWPFGDEGWTVDRARSSSSATSSSPRCLRRS